MIKKCCILVSNDPLDQAIFTKALHDVSPQTICLNVSTAIEALYMMTRENVIPNFIFIELDLPEMDGTQFLSAIKNVEGLKDIHVIVHTTSPKPHKILEIKELGALAIYLRPYEYYSVRNMLSLYFSPSMPVMQQN